MNLHITNHGVRKWQADVGLRAQVSIVHPDSTPPLLLQTLTNGNYSAAKLLIQTLAPLGQFRLPLSLPDLDPNRHDLIWRWLAVRL
jgi:hypothetical protein